MKAVIFDMDGVLINSEPLHFAVDEIMLDRLGIHERGDYLEKFVGCTSEQTWMGVMADHPVAVPLPQLLSDVLALKLEYLASHDFVPIDGVVPLLVALHEQNYSLAIASSSARCFIDAVLAKLGIAPFFPVIISGEEVTNSKPQPDVFLAAQQSLGVEKQNCVIIEDSASGVLAAMRSGMACIGYVNPDSGCQDLSLASVTVDSMMAITPQLIAQLTGQASR